MDRVVKEQLSLARIGRDVEHHLNVGSWIQQERQQKMAQGQYGRFVRVAKSEMYTGVTPYRIFATNVMHTRASH